MTPKALLSTAATAHSHSSIKHPWLLLLLLLLLLLQLPVRLLLPVCCEPPAPAMLSNAGCTAL
jgi:hypothetical protein